MKPARFDYMKARSIAEALDALGDAEVESKVVAGGQSLGPMLNLRLVRPARLIDISAIDALTTVDEADAAVRIGACTTHAWFEDRANAISGLEPLAHAARGIAYRAIRNRGTVGGSLAHADPAGDWPLIAATWGASIEIQGRSGTRRVAADAFMSGAYVTALQPAELLTAVHWPRLSAQARWSYRKFCRKPGEFAEAAVAVLLDPPRRVARVFIGTPAGRPTALAGLAGNIARNGREALSEEQLDLACRPALHGAPAARQQACRAMLRRALEDILA